MMTGHSTHEPRGIRSTAPDDPARPRHLVIADDSAEMRQFVRDAVGRQFDDIIEVADGRALFWVLMRSGFAAEGAAAPDLVLITDVAMPAYNGLEVVDAWRDAARGIPTIIITAFPSETVQARAQELGVVLLAKPFSITKLRQAVRDVLATVGDH
jgi:CheY-like chemotaxis protein